MARNQNSNDFQNIERIKISSITLDNEIQSRCQIYDDVVKRYAEAMRQDDEFPPVIVFYNGSKFWLADGFHRFYAKKIVGKLEILADVWQGNHQDALLHSTGANLDSELKLTEADLHKNVYKLIDHPEWWKLSDKEVSDHCGADEGYVHRLREQRIAKLYQMVVERNRANDPTPPEPLKAKHFDLESALKGDATSFGPLISDYFLDIWSDMVIDKHIRENKRKYQDNLRID